MDDQQQQRINRAAQEFTDALVAAYEATSGHAAAAQEVGARQMELFFDAVMGNLRAHTGDTSQMARQLAGQQRLAQEATRELAQVSTDNYMDLLDSVFSFYQGGASRTQRRAEEAKGRIEEAEARAEEATGRGRTGQRRPRANREAKRASVAKRRVKEARKPKPGRGGRRGGPSPGTSQEARIGIREAQRRAEEAESRAEEAERSRSEAESRGGDDEGDTKADAAS